ncbi:hypothetical protein AB0947_42105, partial [Streptomyces sp. NPDC047841]
MKDEPGPFDATAPRLFKAPFPLKEEWQWEYDYYDHTLHSSLLHQTYTHGSVLLGNDGPGECWTLVVTGAQRGQVWWLRDGCATPYAHTPSEQKEGDFLCWVTEVELVMSLGCSGGFDGQAGLGEAAVYEVAA